MLRMGELAPAVCPACGLDDQPELAAFDEQAVEARVGIGLTDAGVVSELALRMHALSRSGVVVDGGRGGGAAERAIVAHMRPEPARAALPLGEHRHGGVVDVQTLGRVRVLFDPLIQRHHRGRCRADPVG